MDVKYGLESCERRLVFTQISSITQAIDHAPADDAFLVDDEGATKCASEIGVEHAKCLSYFAVWPEICQDRKLVALLLGKDFLGEH